MCIHIKDNIRPSSHTAHLMCCSHPEVKHHCGSVGSEAVENWLIIHPKSVCNMCGVGGKREGEDGETGMDISPNTMNASVHVPN